MAIIIGITAGEIYNKVDPWSPVTYGQSRTYSDSIISAQGVPLILPLTDDVGTLRAMYDSVNGVMIAGGNDIDPKLYGEKPHAATKDISVYRDRYETQLIRWALEDKKPILGICRGMHLVNVLCGGNLYQHIPSFFPNAEDHNSSDAAKDIEDLAHTLRIKEPSKLASILGVSTIKTNTHHHQAINRMAPNLQAVAWTNDGIIEAIESRDDSYFIGVESHPESLITKAEKRWLNLFLSFVQASAK